MQKMKRNWSFLHRQTDKQLDHHEQGNFPPFFFPQIYLIRRKLSPLVLFASVWMGRLFVMWPLISNFMKGTWRWWRGEWGWWRGWGWGRGLRMPRMVWPGQSRGDPSLPGDPDGIDYHYTLCTVHTLYHTGVFQNSKSISNPFLLLVYFVTSKKSSTSWRMQ